MESASPNEAFQFIGKRTKEVYSTYIPIGVTDEEIAHNLHAEFMVVKRFFMEKDEPLSVVIAKDE